MTEESSESQLTVCLASPYPTRLPLNCCAVTLSPCFPRLVPTTLSPRSTVPVPVWVAGEEPDPSRSPRRSFRVGWVLRPRDVEDPGAPPPFHRSPVRLPVPACPLRRANAAEEHTPPKSPKGRSLRALGEVGRRAVRESRPRCRVCLSLGCESTWLAELDPSSPCHLSSPEETTFQ